MRVLLNRFFFLILFLFYSYNFSCEELQLLMQQHVNSYQAVASLLPEDKQTEYWTIVTEMISLDIKQALTSSDNDENNIKIFFRFKQRQFFARTLCSNKFSELLKACQLEEKKYEQVQIIGKQITTIRKKIENIITLHPTLIPTRLKLLEKFIEQIFHLYLQQ